MPPSRTKGWFPYEPHGPLLEYGRYRPRELRQRLATDGIVVVTGVVPPSDCEGAARAMAAWLGERGVDVENPKTWSRYTSRHFEMSESILGMMNTGEIRDAAFVQHIRGRKEVRRVFEHVHGVSNVTPAAGGVFWGFPPEWYPGGMIRGQQNGGFANAGDMWMHTDRGRDWGRPPGFQSLIMLEGADVDDYSFAFLSGSHLQHDTFLRKHPRLRMEESGNHYIQLGFEDTQWFEDRGCSWRKVVAPRGSVVVWSDRLIHSSDLPRKGRLHPKPRFVVYGGYEVAPT